MLIDRSHRSWAVISVVILGVATGVYVVSAMTSTTKPSGASLMGLAYGVVGSMMMIFAGLLAVRRKVPAWRLGSAQFWLRGHIWLGTLSFPLILFHSGFGWGGLVENLLWITFTLVVLSGFFGLIVQNFLPRMLITQVPSETFLGQVPYLCNRMQFLADKLVAERVAKKCGKLNVDCIPLIRDAQEVARKEGWLKRASDFDMLLFGIYESPPPQTKPGASPAVKSTTEKTKPQPGKGLSPIEQMRAQMSQKKAGEPENDASSKPLSPLEMAQKQAAAGAAGAAKPSDAPKSPLQSAREQAAAASGATVAGATVASAARKTPAKRGRDVAKPSAAKKVPLPTKRQRPSKTQGPKEVSSASLADLKACYLEVIRPYLAQQSIVTTGVGPDQDFRSNLAQLRKLLPVELHDILEQLERFCDERRQYMIQHKIHRWLHYWLFLHIPSSIALAVLFVAHVLMALRVVPFAF